MRTVFAEFKARGTPSIRVRQFCVGTPRRRRNAIRRGPSRGETGGMNLFTSYAHSDSAYWRVRVHGRVRCLHWQRPDRQEASRRRCVQNRPVVRRIPSAFPSARLFRGQHVQQIRDRRGPLDHFRPTRSDRRQYDARSLRRRPSCGQRGRPRSRQARRRSPFRRNRWTAPSFSRSASD